MYLLVLDQSTTNSGISNWIIRDDCAELISYGKFKLKRDKNKAETPLTFQPLIDKMNEFKYDEVVLEEVFSGLNKKTFKSLVRLQYQIIMDCYLKGTNYSLIYPTSWQSTMKQIFRLDKWVSKKSSVKVVKELLQINEDEKISNDLAEAILIGLHYLIKVKGIRFENITYQNAVNFNM